MIIIQQMIYLFNLRRVGGLFAVIFAINTLKSASGCDPTLQKPFLIKLSSQMTAKMEGIIVWGFGFDILCNQRCWWGCILYEHDICINMHTLHVAATSFFAGEVEIFDFVTERVKRCIAAKRDNSLCFWGDIV